MTPFTDTIPFFYTRDLQAAAAFYEGVLGLPLALDQGSCRIYRLAQGAFVGFCERENAPAQPEGVILTFVTEDVDGWAEKLEAAGVALEKEPSLNETYGIYHIFFRDSSGYLLEIQRFLDPDWRGG